MIVALGVKIRHWDKTLSDYLTNKFSIKLPDKINEILSINAPIAEKMHEFYKEIQKDKSTPYPSNYMKEMPPALEPCMTMPFSYLNEMNSEIKFIFGRH